MTKVKVKAHKRADGTKVKSHTRKVRSEISKAKSRAAKAKGRLASALRKGASKAKIKSLRMWEYDARGGVGDRISYNRYKKMSVKHRTRSDMKGEKGRHIARKRFS